MSDLFKKASILREESIKNISNVVSKSKSDYFVFKEPTEVQYGTSDGGFICDYIAAINKNSTIYLVEEGCGYDEDYDFEEDCDYIVAVSGYELNDISTEYLCYLSDKLSGTHFVKEFSFVYNEARNIIDDQDESLDVSTKNVTVYFEDDCKWINGVLDTVRYDGITLKDNKKTYKFDDDAVIFGEDCLLKAADAIIDTLG